MHIAQVILSFTPRFIESIALTNVCEWHIEQCMALLIVPFSNAWLMKQNIWSMRNNVHPHNILLFFQFLISQNVAIFCWKNTLVKNWFFFGFLNFLSQFLKKHYKKSTTQKRKKRVTAHSWSQTLVSNRKWYTPNIS